MKKIKSAEEQISQFYEDLKAGKLITVELGSEEHYRIFNKLKKPEVMEKKAAVRKKSMDKQPCTTRYVGG